MMNVQLVSLSKAKYPYNGRSIYMEQAGFRQVGVAFLRLGWRTKLSLFRGGLVSPPLHEPCPENATEHQEAP